MTERQQGGGTTGGRGEVKAQDDPRAALEVPQEQAGENADFPLERFVGDRDQLADQMLGSVMETAFPPDDLADYLRRRGFVLQGRMEEICP